MSEEIKIEKGIPIPLVSESSKYPVAQLGIGDSFLVAKKPIQKVLSAVTYTANKVGFKIKCRTVEGGVRVWRTA